jgi:hypothetical protein
MQHDHTNSNQQPSNHQATTMTFRSTCTIYFQNIVLGVYIQWLTSTKQFKIVGNTIWVEISIYKAKQKSGRKLLQRKRSFPGDQNSLEIFSNFSTGSTYNFTPDPKYERKWSYQ